MSTDLSLDGRNVLVIEDQYLLATEICEWLRAAGADVLGPVPDTRSACELLDSERVDAAVVDINLGSGPTYEIANELTGRSVPFLFATGYDRGAIPDKFSAAPRLEKPFGEADLVSAVHALR